MKGTRLSLCDLYDCLTYAGFALLSAPSLAVQLFFSNGNYGDVLPRWTVLR
jgi:hypothetical protein